MRYTENDISADERAHLNVLRKNKAAAASKYTGTPGNNASGLSDDPAFHAANLAVMEEEERLGLTYPEIVEIIFPPQISQKYGFQGVVIPTADVLRMIAFRCEEDDPVQAKMYREIAETFYAEEAGDEWVSTVTVEELEMLCASFSSCDQYTKRSDSKMSSSVDLS